MVTFSSFVDDSLEFITGDSPESLVLEFNKMRKSRPDVELVAIVPYGTRHVVYFMCESKKPVMKKTLSKKG